MCVCLCVCELQRFDIESSAHVTGTALITNELPAISPGQWDLEPRGRGCWGWGASVPVAALSPAHAACGAVVLCPSVHAPMAVPHWGGCTWGFTHLRGSTEAVEGADPGSRLRDAVIAACPHAGGHPRGHRLLSPHPTAAAPPCAAFLGGPMWGPAAPAPRGQAVPALPQWGRARQTGFMASPEERLGKRLSNSIDRTAPLPRRAARPAPPRTPNPHPWAAVGLAPLWGVQGGAMPWGSCERLCPVGLPQLRLIPAWWDCGQRTPMEDAGGNHVLGGRQVGMLVRASPMQGYWGDGTLRDPPEEVRGGCALRDPHTRVLGVPISLPQPPGAFPGESKGSLSGTLEWVPGPCP